MLYSKGILIDNCFKEELVMDVFDFTDIITYSSRNGVCNSVAQCGCSTCNTVAQCGCSGCNVNSVAQCGCS